MREKRTGWLARSQKAYEPQQIEPRWADFWVKEELFKANANAPGPVFSIVIPPPNVTGSLHMGHMLEHTEIDILTRWHRMRGIQHPYLPGRTGPRRQSRRSASSCGNWRSKESITETWGAKNS